MNKILHKLKNKMKDRQNDREFMYVHKHIKKNQHLYVQCLSKI